MGGHFLNLNPLVRQMDVNFYLKLLMVGEGFRIEKIPIYFRASQMIELFLFPGEEMTEGHQNTKQCLDKKLLRPHVLILTFISSYLRPAVVR